MQTKKILMGLFILSLSGASLSLQAAGARIDYKCYVQLEDQSKVVRGFVSENTSLYSFGKSILGEKVYFADGVTSSNIIAVMECINSKKTFITREALMVAKKTKF